MQKKAGFVPTLLAFLKAIGYFAIWYGVSFVVSLIIQVALAYAYPNDGVDTFIYRVNSLSYGITLICNAVVIFIFAIYYRFRGTGLFSQASLVKAKPAIIISSITLGAASLFVVNYILSLLSLVLPSEWYDALAELPMGNFQENQVVAFLSVALLAPLCEEIVFRGLIAKVLGTRVPTWLAVTISALAFGLVHNSSGPLAIFYATAMGILFGWLFFRTKSLVPCVLAHATFNIVSFFSDKINPDFFMMITYASFIVIFISIFNIIKATKEDKTDEDL
ncbi:MAG: CPBP family intramembrane metalloprotease [Clostridia bacterium]|nr:CPBP family intramembrane metalloprotease [Clostridia bacterium]